MKLLNTILDFTVGGGLVGLLLFYRSRRRKEKVSADNAGFEALVMQIGHLKRENREAYDDLDNLQLRMDQKRETIMAQETKILDLELRLMEEVRLRRIAEYLKCEDNQCPNRKPPRQ